MKRILQVLLVLWPLAVGAPSRAEVVVVEAPATAASPEAQQRALAIYQKKVIKDAARGRFGRALKRLDEVIAIHPKPVYYVARAMVLRELERHREAVESCLLGLVSRPDAETRAGLLAELRQSGVVVEPPLGAAIVSVEPSAAELRIAGQAVPAGVVFGLSAGSHQLQVTAPDFDTKTVPLVVKAGELAEAQAKLERTAVPEPKEEPKGRMDEQLDGVSGKLEEPKDYTAPIALLASGGAVVLAAVGLNVWGAGRADDAQGLKSPSGDTDPTRREQLYREAVDDAELGATLAYVSYGVGGALLLVGSVLAIVEATTDDQPDSQLHMATFFDGTRAGVSLGGRF